MGELTTVKSINGAELTPVSLRIKPGTSPEVWLHIANKVTNVGHGYWWWIGDLGAYAIHTFEKPDKFVEQLAVATGTSLKYIEIIARMSKSYPVRDRVRGLSVRHHQIVQTFPPIRRRQLLMMALHKKMPARLLYNHIIPRETRTTQVILRVPDKYVGSRKFMSDLKDFCNAWHIKKYRVYGKNRPDLVRLRSNKSGSVAMLG